jgi:hypothetical protein
MMSKTSVSLCIFLYFNWSILQKYIINYPSQSPSFNTWVPNIHIFKRFIQN